jgi:ATP/maltotriose-dependent transcriptional regulator MalT
MPKHAAYILAWGEDDQTYEVSTEEIAGQLVIAIGTVKRHVSNILAKLGATNRTQAVARARELSLL